MVLNRLAKGKDQWLLFLLSADVGGGGLGGGGRRPGNTEASRLLTEGPRDTLEGDFSKAGDKKEPNKERRRNHQ